MRSKIALIFLFVLSTCTTNKFAVINIVDGNTLELSNGIIVTLDHVNKNEENVKIMQRYLRGEVILFNERDEEIKTFSTDRITAIVFNSDGDCINNLLSGVAEITKDSIPQYEDTIPKSNTVIPFTEEDGVLKIPVSINGKEIYFIFDTGAGLISISQTVADDLYRNGTLDENDFIGKGQFSDANGDITEGTIINIKSIQIGDRELNNVQACVTKGQNVPLLLGQSALQKFGKVSIDYNKKQIAFE